jgi:hypothetical protein
MMVNYEADGSVVLYRDDGQTLTVETGGDVAAAILAFFGPPPVVRALIRKSTIIRRCHEAGVLTAVMAILDAPANAYAKARWWAPDWPEVFADDPEMVAMLTAVGADVAVITAPEEGA